MIDLEHKDCGGKFHFKSSTETREFSGAETLVACRMWQCSRCGVWGRVPEVLLLDNVDTWKTIQKEEAKEHGEFYQKLLTEHRRSQAQIREAISILRTGTDYEKAHVLFILADGLTDD